MIPYFRISNIEGKIENNRSLSLFFSQTKPVVQVPEFDPNRGMRQLVDLVNGTIYFSSRETFPYIFYNIYSERITGSMYLEDSDVSRDWLPGHDYFFKSDRGIWEIYISEYLGHYSDSSGYVQFKKYRVLYAIKNARRIHNLGTQNVEYPIHSVPYTPSWSKIEDQLLVPITLYAPRNSKGIVLHFDVSQSRTQNDTKI